MNTHTKTFCLALFFSINQNINAASTCLISSQNTIPEETTIFSQLLQSKLLFKPGTIKRQVHNYISPKDAQQLVNQRAAFLIDLRSSKDFQRFHIPNSINIPAPTLKTKNIFKNKHIIIFNEGHSYLALESLYFSLKKIGFKKISILEGGLNQWNKQIGNLIGDLRNLNQITPAQFFLERNYQHWQVINISQINQIFKKKYQIGKNYKTYKKYILITSELGTDYPKVQAKLQHLNNVFYLQGGVQAYRQFLQQQHNQSQKNQNAN